MLPSAPRPPPRPQTEDARTRFAERRAPMSQRKGTSPPAAVQRPRPPRTPEPRPSSPTGHAPRVVQPKTAAASPTRMTPAAPPVYRPQAAAHAALQPKAASQSKRGGARPAQPGREAGRPRAALQLKPAAQPNALRSPPSSQPRRAPVAPPVYRPALNPAAQAKPASPAAARTAPQAPPVYRPNPTPHVLQRKSLPGAPARPDATQARPEPPRPVVAARPQVAQPKPAGPHASRGLAQTSGVRGVVQRLTDCGGSGVNDHIAYGNFFKSDAVLPRPTVGSNSVPLIIELLETSAESAKAKVEQLIATNRHTTSPVAFVFAINARIGTTHDRITGYSGGVVNGKLTELTGPCRTLTAFMEANGVGGGCFPLVWAPTSTTP